MNIESFIILTVNQDRELERHMIFIISARKRNLYPPKRRRKLKFNFFKFPLALNYVSLLQLKRNQ